MQRETVGVLIVAILTITAGCGGYFDWLSAPSVECTEPRASLGEVAPGVRSDGVSNMSKLLAAHVTNLGDRGFRSTATLNITFGGGARRGPSRAVTKQVRAESGYTPFSVQRQGSNLGRSFTSAYWGNASIGFTRTKSGSQISYDLVPSTRDSKSVLAMVPTFSLLLPVGEYHVTATEHAGGRTLQILEATSVNRSFANGTNWLSGRTVSDIQSRLVVDSCGIIHNFTVSFQTQTEEGSNTYDVSYQLNRMGEVSVSPPQWLDAAYSNVTNVDLTVDRQGSVIVLEHRGGDPIPADAVFILETRSSSASATIPTPVNPGETLYLAMNQSGNTLRINRNPIETGAPLGPSVRVVVYTQTGTQLFASTLPTNQTTTG